MKSSRRTFLQISGLGLGALGLPFPAGALGQGDTISIIVDPEDPVASSAPCRWALNEMSHALKDHGIRVGQFASFEQTPLNSFCIVASSSERAPAKTQLKSSGVTLGNKPESLALVPFANHGRPGVLACGDARGLMYALLELADRVQYGDQPFAALEQRVAIAERPTNSIRSIGRIFCSDTQDKPWFYDRKMWLAYFSMLATQRFNQFSLNFGIGYDFLDDVRDAYFLFAYPFLLDVPGHAVRAINLPDEERLRNLETLQFISSQAVAHGIDFQLGIWTHGYHWGPASRPNYTIEGLSSDNHASYSRDALSTLLKACPNISGITIRSHGESGVREGSYSFWSTVFSGLPASGRTVRLDLHPKGLDQKLLDAALQTGMPVTLSPKYWAEHMGLPYHQAAIRDLEMPREDEKTDGFFSLSSGSRSFTRYGYADFLTEDRPYHVMFRIWPGTHRLLLWGDPRSAAAYSLAFTFCGCDGVELFEPLSFKGRRGSGISGSRCVYADASLETHWDWEKYLHTYRVWGRSMYDADGKPEACQRHLQKQFHIGGSALESALASASAITPIITTAHLPSAANEAFNPEYYTNQSIVDGSKPTPYFDTPDPKVFGNVSPLDPQLFSTINEYVDDLFYRKTSGKYSPIEVAEWLDAAANAAVVHLREAESHINDQNSPGFRRASIDIRIQIGIGHFFAAKFRSAILYAAYKRSGDRAVLDEAVKQYRRARDIWRSFAEGTKGAYLSDITFGTDAHQRGNWLDRLPAIDEDIAEMDKQLQSAAPTGTVRSSVSLSELTVPPKRESLQVEHTAAPFFAHGQPLELTLAVPPGTTLSLVIRLYYRHVNQAERYQSAEMRREGARFSATIPANYTSTKYGLQYYFELRAPESAWLFPGLGSNLLGQPYFVVRATGANP